MKKIFIVDKRKGLKRKTNPQLVSKNLSLIFIDAIPKSASLILKFLSRSKFSGFKSL